MNNVSFLQKLQGDYDLCHKSPHNFIREPFFVLKYDVFKSALIAIFDE
jgi:hypothetical protein